jgi:hypothetical protein
MSKLPDKLSDLILVALEDLHAIEQRDDVIVDMDQWVVAVDPTSPNQMNTHGKPYCSVCLAGAVMFSRLDAKKKIKDELSRGSLEAKEMWGNDWSGEATLGPHDFPAESRKLEALNYIRGGYANRALEFMNVKGSKFHHNQWSQTASALLNTDGYHQNREAFYEHMDFIVGVLQAEGL